MVAVVQSKSREGNPLSSGAFRGGNGYEGAAWLGGIWFSLQEASSSDQEEGVGRDQHLPVVHNLAKRKRKILN